MNFKGGKGTASFFGILLYIDWKIAILGLIVLLLFAFVTNYFVTITLMLYVFFYHLDWHNNQEEVQL